MKTYRAPMMGIQLAEINPDHNEVSQVVQLFRVGTYFHSEYGKFQITPNDLKAMEENFKRKVRGIDLAIDYKHDSDNIAAGWIQNLELSQDGNELWAKVDWTPQGKKVLSEKEFRYLSPDFTFDYQDNESLKKFGPTLLGAGLTNRPTIKNMEPVVELSEAPKLPMNEKGILSMDLTKLDPAMLDQMAPDEMKALCLKLIAAMKKEEAPAASVADDGAEMSDLKKKLDDSEKKYAEAEKVCADLKKSIQLSEKKSSFAKLLSEGKVCPAQESAYLSGDLHAFSELSMKLNLSESGNSQVPALKPAIETLEAAENEVMKLAQLRLSEKKSKDLDEAIHSVLQENKELSNKIYS